MARTLDQVMSSLEKDYSGSKGIIQNQLSALPGETDAAVAQADAKLGQANESILAGARRRGLGFSGIPIGEQAQYAATEYAPAIANLKSSQNQKQLTLTEALNQLGRDQRSQAQSIYDTEMARDLQERQFAEQIRQYNENLAFQREQANRAAAAARAAASPNIGAYLGGGASGGGNAPAAANIQRTQNGGFNFFDSAGRPINAFQYSQLTGVGYRELLSKMAGSGDKNAQVALKFVGNDGKFNNAGRQYAGALGALGASGTYEQSVRGGALGLGRNAF